MSVQSPLHLPIPRNFTALLQHLQRLVAREGHRIWCGGVVPIAKLEAFITKMSGRYPILRANRQRTYDRSRGRAIVHFVAYPVVLTDQTRWRPQAAYARAAGSQEALADCGGGQPVSVAPVNHVA